MIYLAGSLGMIALSFKWFVNIKIKLKTTKNYSNGDALAILFLLYCTAKIVIISEYSKSFCSFLIQIPMYIYMGVLETIL